MLQVIREARTNEISVDQPRFGLSFHALEPLLAIADATIIISASIVGGMLYHVAMHASVGDVNSFAGLGLIGSLGYGFIAHHLDFYSLQKYLQTRRDYLQVIGAWLSVVLLLILLLFLFKLGDQASRGSVVSLCALSAFVLVAWRKCGKVLLKRAVARGALRGRRVILIGTQDEIRAISEDHLLYNYGVEAVDEIRLPQHGHPKLGAKPGLFDVDEAMTRATRRGAEEILLAISWKDSEQLQTVRDQLQAFPLPVRLLPDRSIRSVLEHDATARPSILVEVQRAPLKRTELLVKRVCDLIIASVSILGLLPLFLVTAMAIKLDSPGPILFRQRRNGFSGQPFVIYKFRTMHVMEDGPAVLQAQKHDPRVTRLGRILRWTSIDELPQLFNVLSGDMSIVGPRPHALAHDDQYSRLIANYAFRSHVKPGMTGWAQVNGYRGGTWRLEQMKKRIELDLWYINNWSLGLDLQILARTVFELALPRNAY